MIAITRAPAPTTAEIEAAQRAWIAAAVEAAYGQRPPLPRFPRPRREPLPPLPSLLDVLDTPEPPEPPPGREISDLLMELYAGAISPPSPLALKRRALRRERAARAGGSPQN